MTSSFAFYRGASPFTMIRNRGKWIAILAFAVLIISWSAFSIPFSNLSVASATDLQNQDSGKLIFTTQEGNNLNSFLVNADGSEPVKLSSDNSFIINPADWSPDGTKILIGIREQNGNAYYSNDSSGANRKLILSGEEGAFLHQWSPDSSKIAFFGNFEGTRFIYIVNADGSDLHSVPIDFPPSHPVSPPRWSPDGSKVAFEGGVETDGGQIVTKIRVLEANGSNPIDVSGEINGFNPKWSPDSTKIAFTSSGEEKSEVFVVGADGSNLTNVSNSADSEDSLVDWSPDGTKIAFRSVPFYYPGRSYPDIYTVNPDGSTPKRVARGVSEFQGWSSEGGGKLLYVLAGDAYLANSDGTGAINLTEGLDAITAPVWSPDGKKIAFSNATNYGDRHDFTVDGLYTMNTDGSAVTKVTDKELLAHSQLWSADGTKIAFLGIEEKDVSSATEVYVVKADGAGLTNVSNSPGGIDHGLLWQPLSSESSPPTASPVDDGKNGKIAFSSNRTGDWEIYTVNPDGTGLTNVSNTPEADDTFPAWSPDGRKIAFLAGIIEGNEIGFNVVNADGTNLRNISSTTPSNTSAIAFEPRWSPDSARLAFVRDDNIFVADADGSGNIVQLTKNAGVNRNPSWSSDGKKIAFDRTDDSGMHPGLPHIWIMNSADGSEQVLIKDGWAFNPIWSPDGKRIAFNTFDIGGPPIHVMDVDGSNEKSVGKGGSFDWSPDGIKLALTMRDQGSIGLSFSIFTVNLEAPGEGAKKLTDAGPDAFDADSTWSPDGKKIVFSRSNATSSSIYTVNANDGNDLTGVVTGDSFAGAAGLDWGKQQSTPQPEEDGKITFVSDGDPSGIYVMNADGTEQTRVSDGSSPSWSPDGTKIAFVNDAENDPGDIYVMNADGTQQRRLTNNSSFDTEPSWSPDGTKIVFVSDRDAIPGSFPPAGVEIYVMNADGTEQTRLTNARYNVSPDWSSDGTKIAFTSVVEGVFEGNVIGIFEIYVMNADGTEQTKLTNTALNFNPDWSPDGTKIAFNNSDNIIVMNADGSEQTPLGLGSNPSWSPDGTKLVFQSNRDHIGPFSTNEIYVMNADGTEQRRLTNNSADDMEPDWGIQADISGPPTPALPPPQPEKDMFCGRPASEYDNVKFGTNEGEIIWGTEKDDLIRGWGGNDTIYGLAGNDCLKGDDGDDQIWGGDGNDGVRGGNGADRLHGDTGDDIVNGHAGADKAWGGDGDDILLGETGTDLLIGDSGNDTMWGGDDADKMLGEEGNDKMYGDAGNDRLYGQEGDDHLAGGSEDDNIVGSLGMDQLIGDAGNDRMWGNDGNDTLYDDEGDDRQNGGSGNDKCYGVIGSNSFFGCEE